MSTKVTKDKGGTRKKRPPTRSEARRKVPEPIPKGVVALATPTPEPRPAIAVHESTHVHQERIEALLAELGYPCTGVGGDVDELATLLASERAPEALIVGLPGGEA